MDAFEEEVKRCALEVAKELGLAGEVTIRANPLTKEGENYIAVVRAIEADGKDASGNPKTIPMVVKMMHKDKGMRESLQATSTFTNEINMYSHIAPTFREFQKKHAQTKEDLLSFIPRCYKTKKGGVSDLIFLEDLRPSGYTMRDRRAGLSVADCKLVMKSFARLHAFSYAMKEKDPKNFKRLSDMVMRSPFFNPDHRERYSEMFQKIAESTVEGVRPHSLEAAKQLEPYLSGGYFDVVTNITLVKDDLSVITHFDPWTCNILFRDDPPSDIRFVDFQVMLYTSPTADLMYVLNTSVTQELRNAYFDEFIQEYLSSLSNTLRLLGANPDVLSKSVFYQQIKKYALCSLGYGILVAPIVLGGEYEEEKDFNGDDGWAKIVNRHTICMKDPEMQKVTADVIVDYMNKGFL